MGCHAGCGARVRVELMSNLADITTKHKPVALAREMVERAPNCTACVCVLVRENGSLWYDMAGDQRKDILWALQRMIHTLMEEPQEREW